MCVCIAHIYVCVDIYIYMKMITSVIVGRQWKEKWKKTYQDASCSPSDRVKKKKKKRFRLIRHVESLKIHRRLSDWSSFNVLGSYPGKPKPDSNAFLVNDWLRGKQNLNLITRNHQFTSNYVNRTFHLYSCNKSLFFCIASTFTF